MKNVEALDSIDNLQDLLSFPLTDLLPYYIYAINEDLSIYQKFLSKVSLYETLNPTISESIDKKRLKYRSDKLSTFVNKAKTISFELGTFYLAQNPNFVVGYLLKMKPLLLIDTDSSICYYFNSAHELMKYVDLTHGTTYYDKRSLTVPYYRDTNNMLLNRYYISSLENYIKQYPTAIFTGNNNSYYYGTAEGPYNSLNVPNKIEDFITPYLFYYYSFYAVSFCARSYPTGNTFCMV